MRIVAEGLEFSYDPGRPVLRGLDLCLEAGEQVALLGRNGSGKTTLARLLNGLLVPDGGRVLVGDWDTRAVPASRIASRVAYLFQDPRRQIFCSRVADEVAFGPLCLGRSPEQARHAAGWALRLVDLEERSGDHPYELSTAEMRRLALACVLAMQTPIVILDEPGGSLDGPDTERLLGVLQGLRQEGRTVLAITHDMDFAAECFDRAVVLEQGRVWADGPVDQVLARPDLPGLAPPFPARAAARLGLPPGLVRGSALLDALQGR
ncbi:MAG TPA: ABC transporter ATP-binding protein [Candidatus Nitrosotenuis sp.]|nr:ABC transporter ATP-binding protein [Candidatus Nitrosotenuis sp.]